MAAIAPTHDNERVGVQYTGPYQVSMNRYLLERSGKGRARKLLNKLRTPWIECFLFAYPSEDKVLVYHSLKGKREGVKWLFGVGELLPTLTPLREKDGRNNVLVLEGLATCHDADSSAKDLMVSFETREDRKRFEKDVTSFTTAKKPVIKYAKKKKSDEAITKISKIASAMIRIGRRW